MRLIPLTKEVKRLSAKPAEERKSHVDIFRWMVLASVFFATVALTSPFYFYLPPTAEQGDQLTETAPRAWTDFSVLLESNRKQWEEERERKHRRVWNYVPNAVQNVVSSANQIFRTAEELDPETDSPEDMIRFLQREFLSLSIPTADAVTFVETAKDVKFQDAMRRIIRTAYSDHFVLDKPLVFQSHQLDGVAFIENQRETMPQRDGENEFLPTEYDWYLWGDIVNPRLMQELESEERISQWRRMAQILLEAILEPNLIFNEPATTAARNSFSRGDLNTNFQKDERLLTKQEGDTYSAGDVEILAAHREAVRLDNQKRLLGHLIFVAVVFSIVGFYLRKFRSEFQFTTYYIILIPLPVLIALFCSAFMIIVADGRSEVVGYLFPAGAIGMLGVLLLNVRMALLLVTWGCLLFGIQADLNWEFVVVGLFGGYTAVAAVYSIRKRYEVFVASMLVAAVNSIIILVIGFINGTDPNFLNNAALGFVAGIGTFLVLAVLPIVERFGIITDMQLLELSGLQNPMLRHVEEVAPGTWQHTLNVSKLAEAAATEIGVNYLLIRAGCYYHDIGKTAKPQYFTENQVTKEDKMLHQQLKPTMSTFVIKNHVKEGIEMARREGLPERIIDFIAQHHGTTVITYFYHKALEAQARGEEKGVVRIEDYRYPGPKPQSIEAAIVMLADSVEATATAKLSGRTVREDDIQQIVRTTILDKFNDGQFDECNLTLRDLNTIREVFVKVLKSRFHTRIDYPKHPDVAKAKKEKKKKQLEMEQQQEREKQEQEPLSEEKAELS